MFTNRSLYMLFMIVLVVVAACAPSATANEADRFAANWSGTMSFTDRDGTEDVFVTIPSGCVAGEVCGEIFNPAVNCTWEMQLDAVKGNVFEYTLSRTLRGECPAMGGGTFALQDDGTLIREHVTPNFVASGTLGRQAEGYQPMYGFAGRWSGSMSFSADPDRKDEIEVIIPIGCKIGNTCGDIVNITGQCGVYMKLKNITSETLEYETSPTQIECPYAGAGTLTLQSDGTLLVEYTSPTLTTNAALVRK